MRTLLQKGSPQGASGDESEYGRGMGRDVATSVPLAASS